MSKAIAYTCYADASDNYLGRYLGIYDDNKGVPCYVFEERIYKVSSPTPLVAPTSCQNDRLTSYRNGGKRKGTRKSRRNKRRNNRRNKTRRI